GTRGGIRSSSQVLVLGVILLHQLEHGFHKVFGLGAGNENGGRDEQIKSPEFLMTGDVLCWATAGALRNHIVVLDLLFRRELALGMSIEVSALASQHKLQQQFGVQAR